MLKTATFFAFSGAMLASTIAYSQGSRSIQSENQVFPKPTSSSVARQPLLSTCADTLHLEIFGVDTLTYYNWGQAGSYVSGTNHYGDLAKAEYFQNSDPINITDAIFYFAVASPVTSTEPVVFTVWGADGPNGLPGSIITTSTKTLGEIATEVAAGNFLYNVMFEEPAMVTGNYYLGVRLPATGSLAIVTSQADEAPAGSAGFELWSDNSWHGYADSVVLNQSLSHVILPITSDVAARFTSPASIDLATSQSVTFTNTSIGNSVNNWTFQGGNITTSTDQDPVVTFSAPGTFTISLSVEDGSGCSETYSRQLVVVDNTASINEDLGSKISVYPNPATSNIFINLADVNAKNIQVVNAIGQVVSKQAVSNSQATVDVANLSAGMYYVQIETTEGTITKKVSVQK